MTAPRISVVMAASNAAEYLRAAIDSILRQSFGDFEFIIIDDGSMDATAPIIASYADRRIVALRNPENLGLIASLNRGLRQARGELVARMDADDESLARRFEKQVEYLDRHPQVGLCGTAYSTMGDRTERWPVEYEPARLKCQLLFDTGLSHPTVMFRRAIMLRHDLYYDPAWRHAEDYELWSRFAEVTELANVPEILLKYRLHPQSVSHANREHQRRLSDDIRRRMLAKLGVGADERQMRIHTTLMRGAPHTLALDPDAAESWMAGMIEANRKSGYCDQAALSSLLYELWFMLCRAQRGRLRRPWLRFLRSPVARQLPLPNRAADGARLFLMRRS